MTQETTTLTATEQGEVARFLTGTAAWLDRVVQEAAHSHMADVPDRLRALASLSHPQGDKVLLEEACALYDDAIDMMFDGPDESDEGYAKARWREAREKVRQYAALSTSSPSGGMDNE